MSKLIAPLHALMGAVVGASLLGLLEALYGFVTLGMPDTLSPLYGMVLYGLIGIPFGLAAAVMMGLLPRFRDPGEWANPLATTVGSVFAVAPLLLFILMYLSNKVVFSEQGIPTGWKIGIVGGVGLLSAAKILGGTYAMKRMSIKALHWVSVAGVLGVLAGAFAALPFGGKARADVAHKKGVPGGMADNPNVLFLTIDTLRADALGTYGAKADASPALDALAADGVVFEDATAHASWTRSSFASLWSSRIPSSHNADKKSSRLSDDLVLLSESLQDAGVTTGHLTNNVNVTSSFNFDQGYDTYVFEAPVYHFGASESAAALTFYKVVHRLREKLGWSKEVNRYYQPAEVVLADARGFIEANQDSRWMLGAHLMEPHDPYFEHPYLDGSGSEIFNGVGFARAEVQSPSLDQVDYLKRVYADEIRHMDTKIADFVDWLKGKGLYDDLLIVVTADHGEEFGEHGGFWHGTTLYEEQIHVPLIMKLPKGEMAGERVAWQARLIDVAPTVTTAMGVQHPKEWQGEDLLATVRKSVAERKAREAALADARSVVDQLAEQRDAGLLGLDQLNELTAAEALLLASEQPIQPCDGYTLAYDRVAVAEQDFEGNVLGAVKLGGFKLITANAGNPRGLETVELYDLQSDAAETANLGAVNSPVCGEPAANRVSTLGTVLKAEVAGAASGAVQAEEVEVDQAATCRLCAIGYASGPECDDC